MNKLVREIWNVSYKLRPLLKKTVPIKLLRKVKLAMIRGSNAKLKIEACDLSRFPAGINLIGEIRASHSMGQSSRLLAEQVRASGLDYTLYQYENGNQEEKIPKELEDRISKEFVYGINLFHIPPYEFEKALAELGGNILDYRYNIVFWLWELEVFPAEWVEQIKYIDEIWTPSEFVSESIRRVTKKPVITLPYYVDAPANGKYGRKYFNLESGQFLFLIMYDSNSLLERKNPIAAIEAYKAAFSKRQTEAGLVIKISNAKKKELQLLKEKLKDYQNIYFITKTMQKEEVNSLIKSVDVYVSLHRAEGFGLILAEAMKLGTPAIATNWSANTEFMNSEVACMVGYRLVKLQRNCEFYKRGQSWAEPDIEEAADYMHKLWENKNYYCTIQENAKKYIDEKLSLNAAGKKIFERIELIKRSHKNEL